MNQKKVIIHALLVALFCIQPVSSLSQAKSDAPSLSGSIVDNTERKPLKRARVWIFDQYSDTQYVAHPDEKGYYSIQLPEGYYFILIGAPGYLPVSKSIWVRPSDSSRFSVILRGDAKTLEY